MTKASRKTALTNILAVKIGKAVNVENGSFICESNMVRIAAIEDTYIKSSTFSLLDSGAGFLIPQGTVEYFQTEQGEELTVNGSANLASIY